MFKTWRNVVPVCTFFEKRRHVFDDAAKSSQNAGILPGTAVILTPIGFAEISIFRRILFKKKLFNSVFIIFLELLMTQRLEFGLFQNSRRVVYWMKMCSGTTVTYSRSSGLEFVFKHCLFSDTFTQLPIFQKKQAFSTKFKFF